MNVFETIQIADSAQIADDHQIVIVGAGVSGLAMGQRLLSLGHKNFIILEKEHRVGGTWHHNNYPGVACDIASPVYSYTFFPNPEWSRVSAPGPEIRDYLEAMATRFGVIDHIRFGKEVRSCHYRDAGWDIDLGDGETLRANSLISGVGVLHMPHFPDIEGLSSFAGACFHSARWRSDIDLAGKRVGIIGTGSTAAQIICSIVEDVAQLDIFQRTPSWVIRFPDMPFSDEEKAERRAATDGGRTTYQRYLAELYDVCDGVTGTDEALKKPYRDMCMQYLETVEDPDLRAMLTPDTPLGCRRLVMSPSFFEAVQHPHANLITEAIERIEPEGIRLKNGELRRLDVLVLATGFQAKEFCRPLGPVGENGTTVDDIWDEGVSAFESVTLPHMPNFYMIGGPFSAIGNGSYVMVAELQVNYIIRAMDMMRRAGARAIAPTRDAEKAFLRRMKEDARQAIWTSGCKSWFVDENGHFSFWARRNADFVDLMNKGPQSADYRFID